MTTVYDRTIYTADIGVSDWWEFFNIYEYDVKDYAFFDDVPAIAGATYTIEINAFSASDVAQAGRVILGNEKYIGVTTEGVNIRMVDYSKKERDSFGNLLLVPRRTTKRVEYPFRVEAGDVYDTQKEFRSLAAVPALYIGNHDLQETFTFGVVYDFSTIVNGYTITECSATIEEF